ncbi:hypothetical protein [Streptomyces sp. NPDC048248]|uniref:hypothetical protein n=1 Tax=Streptomyces sp. NPDC048248 TaxID=3365523 RepID=UPI0037148121
MNSFSHDTHTDHLRLRESVGHYSPGPSTSGALVEIGGLERSTLLQQALARDSSFVEPDTARDSLLLNEDGSIWDVVTHIELADRCLLLSPARAGLARLLETVAAGAGITDVEITDLSRTHSAIAFEGPRSWRIAQELVPYEISSLVLHGAVTVELPDAGGADGVLARIGSTGEYGYLLVFPQEAGSAVWVAERARALGGGSVGPEGLDRARAEVRHPQLSCAEGLSVREAGFEWLVDWEREDDFCGAAALRSAGAPRRGLVLLTAPAGDRPATGSALLAAGERVGTVHRVAPSPGSATELAYGLLDKPFDVPGVPLEGTTADGRTVDLLTVSSPAVLPRSWSERIGI